MRCLKYLAAVIVFWGMGYSVTYAQTLTVACSPWKPFYYREGNVIKGPVYELAKMVLERAGVDAQFTVQPWKRVYESGLQSPNYMISCISRTPEREHLFHWVGPVKETTYYNYYKLKSSNISMNTAEDSLQYRVGVMRGSLTEGYMDKLSHKDLHLTSKSRQLVELLEYGRVDLILEAPNVIANESKAAGLDPNMFEKALQGYGVTTSLALGKGTDPELVKKIQAAYKSLQEEGKIAF